jgi:hypothetical protein
MRGILLAELLVVAEKLWPAAVEAHLFRPLIPFLQPPSQIERRDALVGDTRGQCASIRLEM